MKFETLETERLFLKKLTPESFKELFEKQTEKEVMDILGLKDREEYLMEKEKSDGGYRTYDRSINAFVMVLKSSGKTIGRCGFHNWYHAHGKAEIGYVVFEKENRKQGYMNEALKAIIEYGFNSMKLNRIEACTSPQNEASLHIIRQHGFTQEGLLRQHFVRGEILEDTLIFSLLRNEYLVR